MPTVMRLMRGPSKKGDGFCAREGSITLGQRCPRLGAPVPVGPLLSHLADALCRGLCHSGEVAGWGSGAGQVAPYKGGAGTAGARP
jgi:hypothetical protein